MMTQVGAPKPAPKRGFLAFTLFSLLLTLGFHAPVMAEKTLMVMGDSLSAAYGVPVEKAWVSLLEERLARQYPDWKVVNESISGETTDGGLRRLPAALERVDPELVILELGGNDGLRGFPPEVIRRNLAQMIELSQQAGAKVLLLGMQIPPNYGPGYTRDFREIYPQLAEQYGTALVPFFLAGIYNREGAMQADGIHPTGRAQPRLLDNVWPQLEPLLLTNEQMTNEQMTGEQTATAGD